MSDAHAGSAIRDFRSEDQAPVRDLILGGLRERWGADFDDAHNPDLDDITTNYVEHGADVVVIELDREIVATGALLPDGPAQARIVRVSVSDRHRRQRLGRQIVGELVARSRGHGHRRVVVMTDTPWTSALALYRSCGFHEVGRDDTDTHFVYAL